MKLLLPASLPFALELPGAVEQVPYDPRRPIPAAHLDAEVLVLWDTPAEVLRECAPRLTRLRLVQALAAGPDGLDRVGFPPSAILANGVGLHGALVAEHALALTLALLRRIPELVRGADRREWLPVGGPQELRPQHGHVTTLRGSRVVAWGFGDIGQHYARYASALGADVVGLARSAGERAGFSVTDDPASVLPSADIVCLSLPAAAGQVLDAATLATLRPGVVVINVGRGTAIDEAALAAALRSGQVGAAGLDVFAVEPLPAPSPLWSAPRTIVSPHSAGGRPLGYDDLIARNVAHLLAGEPIENRFG